MMAFSGVRSSWLMLARNSDLCRLATSSCRVFSSISRKSRAFWMASADWSRRSGAARPSPAENRRACGARRGRRWRLFAQHGHREQRPHPGLDQGVAQPALVRARPVMRRGSARARAWRRPPEHAFALPHAHAARRLEAALRPFGSCGHAPGTPPPLRRTPARRRRPRRSARPRAPRWSRGRRRDRAWS